MEKVPNLLFRKKNKKARASVPPQNKRFKFPQRRRKNSFEKSKIFLGTALQTLTPFARLNKSYEEKSCRFLPKFPPLRSRNFS